MNVIPLTAKDFTTDQEVRWCPGCGDYAILKGVRTAMAQIGTPPHEVVFVSGIGCAARFPYYMATYGFHTIHGRAPAVATGVKLAQPDLDVWVVGGDGDFLSIGGNHLLHALRRDVDLNLLLINNAIYGLTKGQASPTSPVGTRSPSTPGGAPDSPVNAAAFSLGAGAGFVARSADTLLKHLPEMLKRSQAHKGAALVEVYQNCIVFNDKVWDGLADKTQTADKTILVEHGKPLVFGKESNKGLILRPETGTFDIVDIQSDDDISKLTVHDETNLTLATALAHLDAPVALGVLYSREDNSNADKPIAPTYQPMSREDFKSLL